MFGTSELHCHSCYSFLDGASQPQELAFRAAELGYELTEEEKSQPWIGVSGRKGFGVKADDLLDALISSAKHEVDSRHPELAAGERQKIAEQIAIGALRFQSSRHA